MESHKPEMFAIQEKMLQNKDQFRIPNYNCYRCDGHINVRAHGGTALLIHEAIPRSPVPLNTNIQAVAARVTLRCTLTVAQYTLPKTRPLQKITSTNLCSSYLRLCYSWKTSMPTAKHGDAEGKALGGKCYWNSQ